MNDPVKHLKEDQQQELRAIKGRQVSAASTLSTVSSTHDFVESKIEDVKIALEYNDKLRSGLKEAWSDGMIPNDVYQNLMEQIEHENRPREKEIVVLKRQKKFLIEDLDDSIRPVREKLEDAYASLIVDKVMSTTAKQKMKKSKFKREVLEYYHASKMINNKKHAWCHLLGWHDAEFIKAAHIVPKSLQSEEVSYLFGVGEAILSSPRNGMLTCLVAQSFLTGLQRCLCFKMSSKLLIKDRLFWFLSTEITKSIGDVWSRTTRFCRGCLAPAHTTR